MSGRWHKLTGWEKAGLIACFPLWFPLVVFGSIIGAFIWAIIKGTDLVFGP